MSFVFNVVAKNPPTVLFVIGAFLIVVGAVSSMPDLVTYGIWCLLGGFILQVLWLFCAKGPRF